MGVGIGTKQSWTTQAAKKTKALALGYVDNLEKMAAWGMFNTNKSTINIEQEAFVVNKKTGEPLSVAPLIAKNIYGVRPETGTFMVEYDANGVTTTCAQDIKHLAAEFQRKTRAIQKEITALTNGDGLMVNVGTHPLVGRDWKKWLLSMPAMRARYEALDDATYNRENPKKEISIVNKKTGEVFVDRASNLSAMIRCAATQLHFAFPTPQETLRAFNISIAVAGPMGALFGNSPFAASTDTGLATSRLPLCAQAEQKRFGLPRPARSLHQHFNDILGRVLPPLVETSDAKRAFQLSYGATHFTTRIILDETHQCSRIEFRPLDSMNPERAMQALVIVLGILEGLKKTKLPSYEESVFNFHNCPLGLDAPMKWGGRTMPAKTLIKKLIGAGKIGLKKLGCEELITDFVAPIENELKTATFAEACRNKVHQLEHEGCSRPAALARLITEIYRSI